MELATVEKKHTTTNEREMHAAAAAVEEGGCSLHLAFATPEIDYVHRAKKAHTLTARF